MTKSEMYNRPSRFITSDRTKEPIYDNAGRDVKYKYKQPIKPFNPKTAHKYK